MSGRPLVGVFGGTFNPVHVGHLRAAEEAVELLGLAKMLFVPSARPPHKPPDGRDPIAPAEERLAWVRAAVRDNPRFEVDALEIDREGPSYSVDTLRALGERTAPERPVFVVGRDAFRDMGVWKDPGGILALAHLAVLTRPPAASGSLRDGLPEAVRGELELAPDGLSGRHRRAGTWQRLLEITELDVSGSDIRARLRGGRSVRYLLPESVREAVERCGAYRDPSPSED